MFHTKNQHIKLLFFWFLVFFLLPLIDPIKKWKRRDTYFDPILTLSFSQLQLIWCQSEMINSVMSYRQFEIQFCHCRISKVNLHLLNSLEIFFRLFLWLKDDHSLVWDRTADTGKSIIQDWKLWKKDTFYVTGDAHSAWKIAKLRKASWRYI